MEQQIVWILKQLILPPGGLVLLGLFGFLMGYRVFGRLLLLLTVLLLYLLSTPYISHQLIAQLEVIQPLSVAQIRQPDAQAIVVLGGSRRINAPEYGGQDTLGQASLDRVRYAAWLSRRTGLAIIPSGGSPRAAGTTEAQLMKAVLEEEFGVPVLAIEEASRTTRDHGVLLPPILEQLKIKRVIVITHAWHMLRAMDVFQAAGIDALAAPMGFEHTKTQDGILDWLPDAGALQTSTLALHEQLGRWWYRLRR